MASTEGPGPGSRQTPYALVFEGVWEPRFEEIRAEAATRGSASDPDRFVMLAATGSLLRDLVPPDAPAEALLAMGRLVFQGYQLWARGGATYTVDGALLRRLLDDAPAIGPGAPVPPAPAGYLQLPRNLVWGRVAEGEVWEPVDGIFWAMPGLEDPATPADRLDAVVVLGMRPDRPGFSVVPVSAPVEGGEQQAGVRARPGGRDFANVLPGGELVGLHSILNEAEVLKLLALVFQHVAAHPETVTAAAADDPAAPGALYLIRDAADG